MYASSETPAGGSVLGTLGAPASLASIAGAISVVELAHAESSASHKPDRMEESMILHEHRVKGDHEARCGGRPC